MKITKLHAIIIALITLTALSSAAANRIYIKDFAIKPGETKIVEMYVESTKNVRSFQADVILPEGLTMDCENVVLSDRASQHIVYADVSGVNTYTVIAFSLSNASLDGRDGTVVEIPIIASDDFAHSSIVELKDILIGASDNTVLLIDGTDWCKVFVERPIAPVATEPTGQD